MRVEYDNIVLLMAGGQGRRLSPLTDHCPKPLLKLGGKPILQLILENFIGHGFRRFYFSVNYKAEMIEEYFGNGSQFGVSIEYLREKQSLGTAGALSLLKPTSALPILMMNGDVLTKVNFKELLVFHNQQQSRFTMSIREYGFQVPYGVIQTENKMVKGILEKPVHKFFVNAGIYVINPDVAGLIPKDTHFDMTELVEVFFRNKEKITAFPIEEYWLDIGRRDDFDRATEEYDQIK